MWIPVRRRINSKSLDGLTDDLDFYYFHFKEEKKPNDLVALKGAKLTALEGHNTFVQLQNEVMF